MTDELKQWEYDRGYEKGKAEAIEEILDKIDEGVCNDCEHNCVDCIDNCNVNNWEYKAFQKWLKEQGK